MHGELDALARVHAGIRSGRARLTPDACFSALTVSEDVKLAPHDCSVSPSRTAAAVFWTSHVESDWEADEWVEIPDRQGVLMLCKQADGTWQHTELARGAPSTAFLRSEAVAQSWADSGRWSAVVYADGPDWQGHRVMAQVRM